MTNKPIDHSIQPGASNNISAIASDTTNLAPPKKNGSSPSPTAEKEGELMIKIFRGKKATLSPPLGQFFINMILQLAAFAAAIAFGVFAVKSIDIARTANTYADRALGEARIANQVAMLAVCSQSGDVQNSSFAAFCFRVLNGAPIVMPDIANNLFTKIATATTSPTTISSSLSITQERPTNAIEANTTMFHSNIVSLSQPTQYIPEATQAQGHGQPSTGVNQRKILAIAISLSLFFFIAIIAIIIIVLFKKRPKSVAFPCSLGANGNGEQVHGDAQGYVKDQGKDQGDGNGRGYVEEQGVQGHGKNRADLVFEYEGQLMALGYPPRNKPSKQWQKRNLAEDWWKTFRAYFLDSTVSTI